MRVAEQGFVLDGQGPSRFDWLSVDAASPKFASPAKLETPGSFASLSPD